MKQHEFSLPPFVTALCVCCISIFINGWVFGILSKLKIASGSIYNLTLIKHLIVIDALTAFVEIIRQSVLYGIWNANFVSNYQTQKMDTNNNLSLSLPPLYAPPPTNKHFCPLYIPEDALNATHLLTLLNLTLIAIDLYLFIIKALSYREAFVVRYIKKLIIGIWVAVISVMVATQLHKLVLTMQMENQSINNLAFDWNSNLTYTNNMGDSQYYSTCSHIQNFLDRFCCVAYSSHTFVSSQVIFTVILTSCIILTFCYVRIVVTIFSMARINSANSNIQQHRRGVVTAVVILLIFYVLFLPYFVLNFSSSINSMSYFNNKQGRESSESWHVVAMEMDNWLRIVMVFYTILNPLIYACRLSAVRHHSTEAVNGFRVRSRMSFTSHRPRDDNMHLTCCKVDPSSSFPDSHLQMRDFRAAVHVQHHDNNNEMAAV